MSLIEVKKKVFHFEVHRNGFNENVAIADESKWLAMARLRQMYPGASFSFMAGGRK
jgi:hypothetical protein